MKNVVLALALGLFAVPAESQAVSMVQLPQKGQAQTRERVSVKFERTPLEAAIRQIVDQSNVTVTYDATKLPSMRVTYTGVSVPVQQALAAILAKTEMHVEREFDGTLKLIPGKPAGARFQGVITGRVTDTKSGKGIGGVNVSLGSGKAGTITGDDGAYRLSGISSGTHIVSARLVGYAKQSRSVTVGEGATATVDFRLEPSANVLDQVVVTGTAVATELKAVPNAITVVTAKQIEERGITRIDQLFRGEIPGLFSVNMGSGNQLDEVVMFSRGATALSPGASAGTDNSIAALTNTIKTYIDGVEMFDSKYLSQIDPRSIERIELLTGPQASTIYGANAINGVMQIFTKRGSGNKPQLTLGLSSGFAQNNFNSHIAPDHLLDTRVTGVEGRLSYNVGGSWHYVGAWTPGRQTQIISVNGGVRMELAKLKVDVSSRRGVTRNVQNGEASQTISLLRADGLYIYSATSGDGSGLPVPRNQQIAGNTIGISLGYRPFSWWSNELVLGTDAAATESFARGATFSSRRDTLFSVGPMANSSRTSQTYNTSLQLPITALARLNLTFGADHWRTVASSWNSFETSTFTGTIANPRVTRTHPDKNSGAYAQGQLGISDALFFTYGLRSDWNPSFGKEARVLPGRYGVSYTRDVGIVSAKLRGSYGKSIRPLVPGLVQGFQETFPSALDQFGPYYLTIPNPELSPDYQKGGEGGVELYIGNRGSLVVTRYNQTINDLVYGVYRFDSVRSLAPVAPNSTNCSFINGAPAFDAQGYCYRYQTRNLNIGSIRNDGWELQGSVNVGPFTTRGTYSWAKSRVIGITERFRSFVTGTDFTPGRSFNFMPEHTWSLGLTYAHAASTVAFNVNGIGMRYINNDQLYFGTNSQLRLTDSRLRMDLPTYRALGPGYATADMNASHRFSSRVDATLQVTNLTDSYEADYNPQFAVMGRQTRVGFRIR